MMLPSSSKTTALNAHLPDHLQLTAHPGLEATLDQAAAGGWTPEGMAAFIRRKAGPNAGPGVAYALVQQAAAQPQQKATAPGPGLVIGAHPFHQDPENIGGVCRCQLPLANRHHN